VKARRVAMTNTVDGGGGGQRRRSWRGRHRGGSGVDGEREPWDLDAYGGAQIVGVCQCWRI